MILINFAHPLTEPQMKQVEELVHQSDLPVIKCAVQMDNDQPFDRQIAELVDQLSIEADDWQTQPILVNLPGYAPAAGTLLAELHGRIGHFPSILRLKPTEVGGTTQFDVAEIINLDKQRRESRPGRFAG